MFDDGPKFMTMPKAARSAEVQPEPDHFLGWLVEQVNGSTLELGVTLQVGGHLVSGLLTNGAHYFEYFAKALGDGFVLDDKAKAKLEPLRESIKKRAETYRSKDADDDSTPAYIHLREARFYSPDGSVVPTAGGTWWRGRLSEVAGFVLGSFEASEDG